ncbi:3-deoxy-D-manno-octulosonic acid transferase [Sulfitobacter sp. F26204]|uniref:3-deoxy-D-manno-octulosonic acid transferase n=1 Tax=Sulfitobacter sp. F26204 TaxID=2996014 RepID=UPI00225E499F|nr:3-deoxy-D-manno-octulosonic acid transferase [Sulfitobacter sp. F26204]MCX7559398.1 3-deoxy-D-manno-octulosonic acid transferase [Sulfitobacter sp. F26204]
MTTPILYRAWVAASMVLLPFFARSEVRKLRQAGVSRLRAREKLGHATQPRATDVPLIWFHGASVGESLSVLALIHRIGVALPQAQFVITSGTATSATLLAGRLPPRTLHQFAPLDAPGPVRRFLRHWKPDAAVFVESELWPQMLRRTHARGAKLALVNARLSERSMARWRKRPELARFLFDLFSLILTQNDKMAQGMRDMHAPAERVEPGINLKSMAGPLPVDLETLAMARTALGQRPVWIASSTHAGEEETVLAAHKALLKSHPDLCLILAPRHPERGTEVRDKIAAAGLSFTRRTRGDMPGEQVFLADTMGELGIWYALGDIVFLGGSLKPIGGHNPFEVAQSGACVLSGAHVAAFAETYSALEAAGAAFLIADGTDLAARVDHLLTDEFDRTKACTAAQAFVSGQTDRLDTIATRLITALELTP